MESAKFLRGRQEFSLLIDRPERFGDGTDRQRTRVITLGESPIDLSPVKPTSIGKAHELAFGSKAVIDRAAGVPVLKLHSRAGGNYLSLVHRNRFVIVEYEFYYPIDRPLGNPFPRIIVIGA